MHSPFIYKLKPYIVFKDISFSELSENLSDGAIELLSDNLERINWYSLTMNSNDNAIELIKMNPTLLYPRSLNFNNNNKAIDLLEQSFSSYINLQLLSSNESDKAMDLIYKNRDKITKDMWNDLCMNSNDRAIELLKSNPHCINYTLLSCNRNPKAISLLKENIEFISWKLLSENESAIDLLLQYPVKINWKYFSKNKNDKAIQVLKNNPSLINYYQLATNENDKAVEIIGEFLKTQSHVDNRYLLNLYNNLNPKTVEIIKDQEIYFNYANTGIFDISYNYPFIKRRMGIFEEEMMEKVWHPDRYHLWAEDPFN